MGEISYILLKSLKRRNISLSINKLGQIKIMAPFFVSQKKIDDFLLYKLDWINSVQKKISKYQQTPVANNAHDLKKQKIVAKRMIMESIASYNYSKKFIIKNVVIKSMKSRWGSCSTKKNLNFNYRLIYLPPALLDYVVVHELCHLLEHNHGKKFWQEVENILPDYKLREKEIKQYSLC